VIKCLPPLVFRFFTIPNPSLPFLDARHSCYVPRSLFFRAIWHCTALFLIWTTCGPPVACNRTQRVLCTRYNSVDGRNTHTSSVR
jgi:hypothetical protein